MYRESISGDPPDWKTCHHFSYFAPTSKIFTEAPLVAGLFILLTVIASGARQSLFAHKRLLRACGPRNDI